MPDATRTVTTDIDDRLRGTLARAAGLDPADTEAVAARVEDGALVVELAGKRA